MRKAIQRILLLSALLSLTLSWLPTSSSLAKSSKKLTMGTFTIQDIHGEEMTEAVFTENKLTLVNIMATWCSPCVMEMPELEELRVTMEGQGLGVVAFVMDTRDYRGNLDEDALSEALDLLELSGAQFPMLVPDTSLLSLLNVEAYPTTFFVDSEGTVVNNSAWVGSRSFEEWKSIAEEVLASLDEEEAE